MLSVVRQKNRASPPRPHCRQDAAVSPPRNPSPPSSLEILDPAAGRRRHLQGLRAWPPSPRVPGKLKPWAALLETAPRPRHCRSREPSNQVCRNYPPPLHKVGRTRQGRDQKCETLLRLPTSELVTPDVGFYRRKCHKKSDRSVSHWRCVGCEGLSHHQ